MTKQIALMNIGNGFFETINGATFLVLSQPDIDVGETDEFKIPKIDYIKEINGVMVAIVTHLEDA